MLTLYESMLSERQRLEQEIKSIQDKIRQLPDGKLICARNGNYIKWFQSDGRNHTYIPKRNRKFAEQLAAKKYLSLQEESLLQEQRAIDFYLHHHQDDSRTQELLNTDSEYFELLSPYFSPKSQELRDWMQAPYLHNEKYPEQLIHKTSTGIYVRSKSEAIIAMLLHTHNIPFRYECALQLKDTTLKDTTVFPDFTLRHPHTGFFFYWEHFGIMDNAAYCQNACAKLQLYASNGIYPSIQLLTTYETQEHPLSFGMVESIIKHYFSYG